MKRMILIASWVLGAACNGYEDCHLLLVNAPGHTVCIGETDANPPVGYCVELA